MTGSELMIDEEGREVRESKILLISASFSGVRGW